MLKPRAGVVRAIWRRRSSDLKLMIFLKHGQNFSWARNYLVMLQQTKPGCGSHGANRGMSCLSAYRRPLA
jgi:hypothetical protein